MGQYFIKQKVVPLILCAELIDCNNKQRWDFCAHVNAYRE